MSIVQIDVEQLLRMTAILNELSNTVGGASRYSWKSNRLNGFTRVSGLDQLGAEHARVLDSGPALPLRWRRG